MKVIEIKSTHVTFTMRRATCSPVKINDVQLPQPDEVKYLGLYLDRRLTWHKHIFSKRKQLGLTLIKMHWLLGRKSQLSATNKLLREKLFYKYTRYRNYQFFIGVAIVTASQHVSASGGHHQVSTI
jgi:hypothetical protein